MTGLPGDDCERHVEAEGQRRLDGEDAEENLFVPLARERGNLGDKGDTEGDGEEGERLLQGRVGFEVLLKNSGFGRSNRAISWRPYIGRASSSLAASSCERVIC